MQNLKGTKTEANLQAAFDGESQARNKYTYFADVAKQEGHEEVAKFFERSALHEMAHARIWFKLLNGGSLSATSSNLQAAIDGESYEQNTMYPEFSKIAREEGFTDIAELFDDVAKIEAKHEAQFKAILEGLGNYEYIYPDTLCLDCGNEFTPTKNTDRCPVCGASSAFLMQQ